MNPLQRIRQFENLHILLWLCKDSCWMMQWKLAGTLAFFPTMAIAMVICIKTWKTRVSLFANLSVLCWISANSCWMFSEFFSWNLIPVAIFLFASGVFFIAIYLFKIFIKKETEEDFRQEKPIFENKPKQ